MKKSQLITNNLYKKMKRILATILFMFLAVNSYSQWVSNFGGFGDVNFTNAKGNAITTDNLGFSYVTGFSSEGLNNNDIITIKYGSQGDTIWVRTFNGTSNTNDEGNGIYVDSYGNVYVVGSSQNLNKGYDVTILKYNANGNLLWSRTYSSVEDMPREDKGLAIAADLYGYIYVTGYTTYSDDLKDIVTLKYDSEGNLLWAAREDGSGNSNSQGLAITVSASGYIYVAGYVTVSGTNTDIAVIKYNSLGGTEWIQTLSGTGNGEDKAWGIAVDATDNVYVAGYTTESYTGTDAYTAKLNSAGATLWSKKHNGTGNGGDKAWGVVVDTDGSVFITGESTDYNSNVNYVTEKYSSTGGLCWTAYYNGTGNGQDVASSIAVLTNTDNSRSVVVTGKSWGTTNTFDYATVRYSNTTGGQSQVNRYSMSGTTNDIAKDIAVTPSKKIVITGYSQVIIESTQEQSYISTLSWNWESELTTVTNVPQKYALHQNYPNPFNPSTTISFDIKNAGNVKLTIYDMLGKSVDVLVNQHMEAGSHKITFSNINLASGVYFYELSTAEFRDIKKMTLVK